MRTPATNPVIAPVMVRRYLYMIAAGTANAALDEMFMTTPHGPVPENGISTKAETTANVNAATGPKMKPPMTTMMSLGSYVRNGAAGITGIRIKMVDRTAMAANMPMVVRYFVRPNVMRYSFLIMK